MSLLSPWWLLLLPLLYLVIILHTLHPQHHRVLISSVLLWERVRRQLAADARWRRLVANLLLLVQLLALFSLILALAHPAFLRSASRLRQDIVLIDTSLSMNATDLPPNRLQAATNELMKQIRTDRPRRIAVITAGPNPDIVYHGPASVATLQTVLRKIEATHGETDWNRAAVLVRSVLSSDKDRILIVTDGAFDSKELSFLAELAPENAIQSIKTAGFGVNVGITAFDARQVGASLSDYEVLITVANFSSEEAEVPLTLRGSQGVLGQRRLLIPAGEGRSVIFSHTFAGQEILHAEITYPDTLAVDNQAYLIAYPPTPTRVLLVGPGNYFLERGLQVFPQVRLERRLLYPGDGDYSLVIFNRLPVPENFRGTGLYLAGAPADEASGTVPSPEITWWNRSHPLTRFIDWSDVGLLRAFRLDRQPGARVLVESEAGPLLQLVESDEARILTLSFALEESDWPHRVGFPVFLSQLLQWAHPEGWDFVRSPLRPGEPFVLPPFLADADGWRGRMPSGATWHLGPGTGGIFWETNMAGIYTVEHPTGNFAFAVNAGSPSASDLRPRLVLPQAADETGEAQTYHSTSLWRPLVFWTLLLLVLETWLYTNKARPPVRQWSEQKGTE
ncbi:MAG: VWA domain-containing protein [Firmicutes bacterium]|jgi:hypothetical protein|nr:VWA domain-containing protein [Bacillota bacterium]